MNPKIATDCDCTIVHESLVKKALKAMPKENHLVDVCEFFKVLGDPTRIKITCALAATELCVCDLAAVLGMKHSAVSHQLKVLRSARLVKARKDGKIVYYSLKDDHVSQIFALGKTHIAEQD